MSEFLNERVRLHCGDMREVLATLPENSLDACVTDPPYCLTSIVKRFGADDAASAKSNGATGVYARASGGFMNKRWDNDVAFRPETWAAVYRVLKPGAHLIAMGGTRTYHRLACAIEDAGFEIRDTVSWLYGSGFPKSHDVSKGIDRAAGGERDVVGQYTQGFRAEGSGIEGWRRPGHAIHGAITAPATDAAREWAGWGTALKPACELIVLARKPLSEGTVAANVLRWGTGAININACRVGTEQTFTCEKTEMYGTSSRKQDQEQGFRPREYDNRFQPEKLNPPGRWPANVVHDGSDEVVAAFPESESNASLRGDLVDHRGDNYNRANGARIADSNSMRGHNDSGSAARFFYTSKADADDRLGSKHPTVKPLDLMQWLVRLVTPKNGTVLDCFAGTGTTGEAAWREGMSAVLIEAEPEYQADIRRRMALVLAGPDERARESIKARNLPRDDGPLFAALADNYNASDDFARSIEEAYRVIRERKANGGKGWGESQ